MDDQHSLVDNSKIDNETDENGNPLPITNVSRYLDNDQYERWTMSKERLSFFWQAYTELIKMETPYISEVPVDRYPVRYNLDIPFSVKTVDDRVCWIR
jgi:hypothetical protein